jgi:rod shape-determining protein MreC
MADTRDDFIIAIRYALLKKGAKQKFSLIFLISLSILVVTLDRLSVPFILSTKSVLNDFVYRVSVISSQPGKFINYSGNAVKNHYAVSEKNKILEKEVLDLKSKRYNSLFLKTENETLKKALSINNITTNKGDIVIPARVMLDQNSPYLKSLLINKGKKEGIIKGMTVFNEGYLVGRIIESNFLSARVLLITDLNSKIPVIIEDTDANGILVGMGKKTNLSLEYLPDEFSLEPNKVIFTSGKDGTLSAGMPIAETYLNKNNKVQIKSLTNPTQALIVHVTSGQMSK